MSPQAFVLDFDGVLGRTMEAHAEAYRRILAPYGANPTNRDVFALEGARSETIIRETLAAANVAVDDATIGTLADAKQQAFAALGPHGLYDDAPQMVQALAKTGLPMAIVTGTRLVNLERLLGPLAPLFAVLITQETYTRDKPDPEPYLAAAAALKVDAKDCAALENATRGIQSARSAGYGRVVGICTTMESDSLKNAGAEPTVTTHQDAAKAMMA